MSEKNKDWKNILSPEVFHITREKGTERPFSGKYNHHDESGIYKCTCCDSELFTSESKFDSGCGWPAFDQQINQEAIYKVRDTSHGMIREEILCSNCDAHLGHIFNDGPTHTQLRYCVNSLSLSFQEKSDK